MYCSLDVKYWFLGSDIANNLINKKMKQTKFFLHGLLILVTFVITNVRAQQNNSSKDPGVSNVNTAIVTPPDSILMKMNIIEFCQALKIPSEYNKRYESIILPLCEAGVYLFTAENNKYCRGIDKNTMMGEKHQICYCYVGNSIQNELLKRNILANRQLIGKTGILSTVHAKKWKVVK